MKELSIVYQNADYAVRYECELHGRNYTNYIVFFEDERMKEQFGSPFEFITGTYPQFFMRLVNEHGFAYDSTSALNMADAIIKAIAKEDSL